ncbi:sperm-activating peptides-like [Lytechinus variegatus]|uniref:sperm-activating peptides-like n=1 Tax=Lytechinus variegatus TaxID=7654 RepID=UPI001BB225AA|nr:sperm-activating peptides-like [Lytechinus variegatus]
MKSIACLLVLLAVAYGKPIIADQDSTSYSLSDTSKYLESIAHMAIVESLSPLHTSLSSLESSWINLVSIAIQEQVSIPQPTVPKIDVMSMLTCKAKYSPKYSMVLKYITDHQDQIQEHIVNAKKLEQDLKFTSQLVMYKKSDPDTKDAMTRVSQMVSDYLKDYSTTISSIKSTICRDQPDAQEDKLEDDHRDQTKPSHPLSEDYMETPLSLYLKGTMPLGAVVTKG